MHPNRFIMHLLITLDLPEEIGLGHNSFTGYTASKEIIAVLFITSCGLDFRGTFIIYVNNGIHCSNYYASSGKRGGVN